jgi:ATP-dependent RNA helicase DeaD
MTVETEQNEISARFEDYGLRPEILRAIARKGFAAPMPVQSRILEDETLTEGDLIVQARTGSGKTLAFAIPILNGMEKKSQAPQVLVLSPTRELAQQTAREFAWLGVEMGATVAALVGGLDMERQIRSLKDGASVVVGTPGRVLDHIRRGSFVTGGVRILVLDEGDHMLDMGFRDELEAILSGMENLDKTWLFSATMPPEVTSLARRYLDAPRKISLVADITCHDDISQKTYVIPARKRFEGLANVLLWENPARTLMFCATKIETQEIADKLCDEGFKACAIHGDMSQRERNNALASLRGGRVDILVATDVAARGLDIDGISHVIQFGLPGNLETFVHRSGRTGRAGHEGANLALLTGRELRSFKQMVHGSNLQVQVIPAPDAAEIEGTQKSRFENALIERSIEDDEYRKWAVEVLEREDSELMVAGLLACAYGEQPHGYSIRTDVQAEMNRDRHRDGAPERERRGRVQGSPVRRSMAGGVQVRIAAGRDDGWEVGALLGAFCRSMGISREDVGNIKLRETSASIELSPHAAEMLESRKSRMTKEGLVVSSVKFLEEGEKPAERVRSAYRERPERPAAERRDRDRPSRRRKTGFEYSRSRRD